MTISTSQPLRAIAAVSDYTQSSLASAFYSIRVIPPLTWTTRAVISYGTPLSTAQLGASSTVAGTFAYSSAVGTVLPAGSRILSVTLTPTDLTTYTPATTTAILIVNKSPLTISAANAA